MTRLQLTGDQGMSLFTKVDMNTPEPRENPDNEDAPEIEAVPCRGCDHFILYDELAEKWNGWWWCDDCWHSLQAAGASDALRADELRDDALEMAGRVEES